MKHTQEILPTMSRILLISFSLCLMVLLGESRASAQIIVYNETFTDSGTLGATSFTNELITFTSTADASTVQFNSVDYYVTNISTTVNIQGVGTATLTNPSYTNSYPSGQHAGLEDAYSGLEVVDINNPAFATYDLTTSTGTLTGTVGGNWGGGAASYATSLGTLSFSTPTITSGTFEATAVPEPSQYGLIMFVTFLGLVGYRHVRQKRSLARLRIK